MPGRETPPSAAPCPAAVILAGGEGSRLGGVIKANIELGARRLLARVAGVLSPAASPVLVSHGRFPAAALDLPAGLLAVADLDCPARGPLAGLAAAVAWLAEARPETEWLVSAAVDTPFLPADFVPGLLHRASGLGAAAVLAACGDQFYPTNAIWRLDRLRDLPRRTIDGTAPRSLKGLAAELGAVEMAWPEGPDGNPFANINTPADLVALTTRTRASHQLES